MSIEIVEGRKNNAFSRMQTIFDLSKRISDEKIRAEFLQKAKTISLIRNEFVEYLEKYFELMLATEKTFKVNYTPLNSFDDMYAAVNSLCISLEEKRLQKMAKSIQEPGVNVVQPRLPKLQIPDFHGNQEEWPVFYQLFTKLIHDNKNISKLEKINYLVTHLQGPAKSICCGILPTEENYDALYTSLVERYEDERLIATTYLDKLLNFRHLNSESDKGLTDFLEQFVEAVTALKQLNISDLGDFLITHIALKKLDDNTVRHFEMNYRKKDIPTFDSLVKFVKEQVKILGRTSNTISNKSTRFKNNISHMNSKGTHSFVVQKRTNFTKYKEDKNDPNYNKFVCILCNEKLHPLYFCPVFKKKSISQRLQIVRQHKACFNCLSIGKHGVQDCQSRNCCVNCGKRHHTLICINSSMKNDSRSTSMKFPSDSQQSSTPETINNSVVKPVAPTSASVSEEQTILVNPAVHCASSERVFAPQTILLATAVILVRDNEGNYHQLRALLDPGSQSHFITRKACENLNLVKHSTNLLIKGISSHTLPAQYYSCLNFKSSKPPYPKFCVDAIVIENITDMLPTMPISLNNLSHLKHIPLADRHFHIPGKIDVLLGAEIWPLIMGSKKVFGPAISPVALESSLGYLLMGRTSVHTPQPLTYNFCACESTCVAPLIEKFWKLEEIPRKIPPSHEDEDCENQFIKNWKRLPDGRFSVALPFKAPTTLLGTSKNMAIRRFLSLESRLIKNEAMYAQYKEVINDYLNRGYMSQVPDGVSLSDDCYFLPHHGVSKKDSISTPLRIVFDASAPTDSGYSLNDILHAGPKLQNNIFDILLNFRLFSFALCSDISKMYLQIFVHASHHKYQRLIWRYSPSEDLKTYELKRVTFGITSSPFLAQRVVQLLAETERKEFPLAADVAIRDIYIDDIATSIDNEEGAIKLHRELIGLFEAGGFPLAKWSSNSKILNQIFISSPISETLFEKEMCAKVLGVAWTSVTDTFSFHLNSETIGNTKRAILSTIAKIFDPLGLLAPILTFAKLIMKELWEKNIDWDEEPPDLTLKKWKRFIDELPALTTIQIPRHNSITLKSKGMLIGFADASERAYGAVIYIRSEHKHNTVVRLLCAKSKVAPSKSIITIPRLELCAALLLSKLIHHVLNVYHLRYTFSEVLAFSDSTVVLHWIASSPSKWKVFVSNRISQIQENLSPGSWRYVRSEHNPADCLSRGLTPATLNQHHLWFRGPPWLSDSLQNWPQHSLKKIEINDVALEEKPVVTMSAKTVEITTLDCLLDRCSNFLKLLRITAYIFRVFHPLNRKFSYITAPELKAAENFWIIRIQDKHFASLKRHISNQDDLPPHFRSLDVFLEDDIVKVGGRLQWSHLPYEQKHPILLPKKDRLVELIIEDCHSKNLHAGPHLVFSILRRKYWIISSRSEIRKTLRKCNICFKTKPEPVFPKMAPLPALRVQEAKAFFNTGVDYCGPFMLSIARRRGSQPHKAYICLFICLTIKALHLELVYDLSTSSFLSAFKRFISRRGHCSRIQSDNATNFIGARNRLDDMYRLVQSSEYNNTIGTELSARKIEWHFNPPASPHFGGIWEANIKSVKSHLKRVIGNQILSYDEFHTVLVQVEAVLNSRPLCVLSDDVNAPSSLTPSHFLTLGSPLQEIPAVDVTQLSISRLHRYQLLDRIVQDFWKIWKQDYLTSLQIRHRWTKSCNPLKKGTVVLLKKENVPPLKWPLGIIEEVFPGSDEIVRVVTVKTTTGMYRRSVTNVCPLPTQ